MRYQRAKLLKKSVTKVSEDYYRVENIENSFELNNQQSVFFEPKNESAETIDTSINSNPEFVMPDNKVVEPVVSDEIANSIESLVQNGSEADIKNFIAYCTQEGIK